MHRFHTLALVVSVVAFGCSSSAKPSPFSTNVDGGADAPSSTGPDDARAGDAPILGKSCLDDAQCEDGIACTRDSCNRDLQRCQTVLDDSLCQNGVYCDGIERCDPDLGCRQGSILDCSDDQTCTIDACVEASRSCTHILRDADGDGSPDGHCQTGGDCDDDDPTVNPLHVEVCGNKKDDNCDGRIDEAECQKPVHDTCFDPLLVDHAGVFEIDTTAASVDYPGTCMPMMAPTRRDVVAALTVAGGPLDADIVAEAPSGAVSVAVAKDCGVLASEIACGKETPGRSGASVARVRARSLATGSYPVYVWTDRDEKILLHVNLLPPSDPPANETCATAAPIAPGVPVVASLAAATRDLSSRCGFDVGDLVYKIVLSEPADVTAYATSLDGFGAPVVSIRRESCSAPEDELGCGYGSSARAFLRALPKGTYAIAVSADGPTDAQLVVDVTAATLPPADEACAGAPLIAVNRTVGISLAGHTDDIDLRCAPIASVDAAYALELGASSDVLLVERIAEGDTGAVSLASASCAAGMNVCGMGRTSPVRASARSVAPGSYRVVAETLLGNPIELTAFVRASVPPTLVPFADTCAAATAMSEEGGFYQGNTSNAAADYSAGCDVAGTPPGGAADQIMKLTLHAKKRVIFDMQGSAYWTLLDVRKGAECPGLEMPGACSVGYDALRSYLDLTLDAGVYWIQVDGYGSQAGAWFLDVRVVDP